MAKRLMIVGALLLSGCGLTGAQLQAVSRMAERADNRAKLTRALAKRYPPPAADAKDFGVALDQAAGGLEAQAVELDALCRILNVQGTGASQR
jgi:hypothetical protein